MGVASVGALNSGLTNGVNGISIPSLTELELQVVCQARAILISVDNHCLKAVEVANALRASLGNDSLVHVRELCGGLLTLLERHPNIFRVCR